VPWSRYIGIGKKEAERKLRKYLEEGGGGGDKGGNPSIKMPSNLYKIFAAYPRHICLAIITRHTRVLSYDTSS
jgi:hypothetical protein